MTRIVKLKADNFKRLKAVEITPTGDLVVVSGRNGQGKTSVLDAITAALGGTSTKALPRPIRDGETSAEIVLETEELTITRRFTPSGSTLTVVGKDGVKIPKGQSRLDALLGRLSLDPLAFTQLDERKQRETLLELVDLPFDPAELDARRADFFERRTETNRELKQLQARLATFPEFDVDQDYDEVSVADLLAEYRNAEAGQLRVKRTQQQVDVLKKTEADLLAALADVRGQIAEAEIEAIRAADAASNDRTLEDIQQQVANAEQINAVARQYSDYLAVISEHADVAANADRLTQQIAEIDELKADGLKAAKFPGGLPLGFDDTGVLLNGVPFKQASGAEQLRASLAMAIALNPELRVIRIADGSLLDSEGLQLVAEMATAADCQVWIEVVSDGDGFGFMIEDGEVADPDFF